MVDQPPTIATEDPAPGETFSNTIRSWQLWVVLTPPDDAGSILIAPIFPLSDRCDGTCVLPAGCHPRLPTKDHAVDYDGTRVLTAERRSFLAEHSFLSWEAPFDAEMTLKIQQGAVDSDCTPTGYQKIIADLLGAT